MADTSNLTQFLTDVANAIKEKTGKTEKIPAANFDTEIKAIKTGSSGEVKLFETEEVMQADTNAKEGDLAVVYRSDIKSVSNGDVITSITFPKTVVFDTAITSSYYGRLRNSSEPRIYLDIQLDASRFMLYDMYGTIPEIEYSSTDGITYTRTDSNEDTYEIGETTVKNLDEHICKFMQVGGYVFEGLYKYSLTTGNYFKYTDATNNYELYSDKCIHLTTDISSGFVLVTNTIDNNYHTINDDLPYIDAVDYVIYDTTNFNGYVMLAVGSDNQAYIIASPHSGSSILLKKEYTNGVLTNTTDISTETIKTYTTIVGRNFTTSYGYELYRLNTSDIVFSLDTVGGVGGICYKYTSILPVGDVASSTSYTLSGLVSDYLYIPAPTQLTLKNVNELLPGKIAYGKNGVIEGDRSIWDNIPISTVLENYYGLSLINNNVYGDTKYVQSYNVTNKNPGKMMYLKESSDGDISINRLIKETDPIFYNSSYTRKLVIKSSTNADYMDIDGKNVLYSITTGMYLGRDDTMEVINDKFYYTTLANNVCKINCLDLNTGINTEIIDFSDTSYTWSDTWVTMLGCKNYIAINSFWRSSTSNRHLNRLGKIDLSTNTYTQIYNHSGTGTSTGGYLWLTKSNIYLSTYTTSNVHSLYKLNLSTGVVTTCFTNKNIDWSMSGGAGYRYGIDDDNYLFLTQNTYYAINLNTGAVHSYTVESNDTNDVSGVTVVLSNGTDVKCIQETINGVRVLSLYEYTYSVDGTKVTITRGNLLFRYNILNMDRTNETEDYTPVDLYSGVSQSLAWLHFAFVGLFGFDICCNSFKTHLLGWKRYNISTLNDYDVVVLDTSLNDSAPYNIVFKSNAGFENNSGPISQEEYNQALTTANEIKGGNV